MREQSRDTYGGYILFYMQKKENEALRYAHLTAQNPKAIRYTVYGT